MKHMSKIILTILLFLTINLGFAQEIVEKITLGHTLKITSGTLGEDRNIFVYLPQGYHESEKEYPVLFLLDGRGHFHHGSGIVQFLSQIGFMPQTIVVAIPNTARQRDFTPTVEEGRENAGGADNFLDFLQNELIPVIDSKYRTHQYRILFGHSLTGMFSVYTFVTRPELFDAYIAASPYLQYDKGVVVKKAAELLSINSIKNKTLYLSLGDEPIYLESMGKLTGLLNELDVPGLEWKYVKFDNDNHASVPHKTIYQGLEFIFSGWQIPTDKANDLASIQDHYSFLSQKFGFAVRPSEFLLNRLGYQIMGNKEFADAIEVFQANVKNYPNSDNVYDSLGEAYEKAGKLKLAAENYKIAVEKGKEANSRNLAVYEVNLERVRTMIAGG
jgi:predicted alpha/beta superfamily hydrolase